MTHLSISLCNLNYSARGRGSGDGWCAWCAVCSRGCSGWSHLNNQEPALSCLGRVCPEQSPSSVQYYQDFFYSETQKVLGYNNSIIISKPPHLSWSQMAPALSNLWGTQGSLHWISHKKPYLYLLEYLIRIKTSPLYQYQWSFPPHPTLRWSTDGAIYPGPDHWWPLVMSRQCPRHWCHSPSVSPFTAH